MTTATVSNTTNVTAGWNPVLQVVYRGLDPTLPMSLLVGIRFYKWFTEERMMMKIATATGSNTSNVTAGWNPVLEMVHRGLDDDGKSQLQLDPHYQCHCWLESGFTSGSQRAG